MSAFVVFRPDELVKPRHHRIDTISVVDQQLDEKVLVIYRIAVVVKDMRTGVIQRYAIVVYTPPYVVYLLLHKI